VWEKLIHVTLGQQKKQYKNKHIHIKHRVKISSARWTILHKVPDKVSGMEGMYLEADTGQEHPYPPPSAPYTALLCVWEFLIAIALAYFSARNIKNSLT
jgi:hypothetical protein